MPVKSKRDRVNFLYWRVGGGGGFFSSSSLFLFAMFLDFFSSVAHPPSTYHSGGPHLVLVFSKGGNGEGAPGPGPA